MSRVDYVGLAKQAAFGTAETVMEYFPPVSSFGPNRNAQNLELDETQGDRFPEGIDGGTEFFELAQAGAVHMVSFPRILSACFGLPDTGAIVGTLYPHVFDPTVAGKKPEFHSLFGVRKDPTPNIVDLYSDGLVNDLELTVAVNTYLTYVANWIALNRDGTQAAPAQTQDVSTRRKFTECKTYVAINGGAEAEIKTGSWSVKYSNGLVSDPEEVGILGSAHLLDLPVANASLDVTVKIREQLNDYYQRAFQTEPDSVALRMTATAASGEKVEVKVAAFETISAPAEINASQVLRSIEVTGRGKKDDAEKFVSVEIDNTVAAYI